MNTDAAITVEPPPDITASLKSFLQEESTNKASLERLLESNREQFCHAAVGLLASAESSAGFRYLVHLLLKHGLLIRALADTDNCRLEEAIAIVKSLIHIGSSLETELERSLSATLALAPSPAVSLRIRRLMHLLAEISKNCFLLFQSELVAHSDPTVRASAVLLIGRTGKNRDLMGRMLLDPSPRVQANAVEALWVFKEDACLPMLLTASRSKHNRVAGNAAVGLYRISELRSIPLLLEMARNPQAAFRITAFWAMGETGDSRFVPFLTDMFRKTTGGERVAALRAMTRIRSRTLARTANPPVEIRIARAQIAPDQSRHLTLKPWSIQTSDFQSLKSTDFAIWEGENLICDYSVAIPGSSVLLAAGFVCPRILSEVDPYRLAIVDAATRCLQRKRPYDIWRMDRFVVEGPDATVDGAHQVPAPPYDDVILGANIKTQHGFLSSPELLQKLISAIGTRDRAVPDLLSGIDRVSEAIGKHAGKRHMFLFLHPNSTEWPVSQKHLDQLSESIHSERIAVHGFALQASDQWTELREICLSSKGGTFTISPVEELAEAVEELYSELSCRFEISYKLPSPSDTPGDGLLVLSSDLGCGQSPFSLVPSTHYSTERRE